MAKHLPASERIDVVDITQGLESLNAPGFKTKGKILRVAVMTKGATTYYVPIRPRMKDGVGIWGRDREEKIARVR